MWYFYVKAVDSDLLLLGLTWSGKVHSVMWKRRSGNYEKQKLGLTSRTEYSFFFGKVGYISLVL